MVTIVGHLFNRFVEYRLISSISILLHGLQVLVRGKKGVAVANLPPKILRVKVPAFGSTELRRKHSLTIIGRLTNPATQRTWLMIPCLADLWKSLSRSIGADLGQWRISERVRPPQSSRKPTLPLCKMDGHQPKVGTNNVKLLPIILDRCARHPCSSLIGRNPL